MHVPEIKCGRYEPLFGFSLAGFLIAVMWLMLIVAPREQSMGDTQRIVYLHVAVAWFGLLAFMLLAGFGVAYLVSRNLGWDYWSQASAEVGWLCSTLTLVTGSLWAHEAWNTWWTWDPRLTTSLILWTMYAGYFIVRSSVEEAHARARIGAVLSIIGVLDVPVVVMATRWFRGVHPVSPEMETSMHVVLLISLFGFTAFFAYLLIRRRGQLALSHLMSTLEQNGSKVRELTNKG